MRQAYEKRYVDPRRAHQNPLLEQANWYEDRASKLVSLRPEFTMRNVVPWVYEKLDAQLTASAVMAPEREKFINDLSAQKTAFVSFPLRVHKFGC